MPCLIALFALFIPRVIIVLLVIAGDYIGTAFDNNVVPFLGFIFLPLTTLAYAFTIHSNGSVQGVYIVIVGAAVLADLGVFGHSGNSARKRRLRGA